MNREGAFKKLENKNPIWPSTFMMIIDNLLEEADGYLVLRLDYQSQGILKEAAAVIVSRLK